MHSRSVVFTEKAHIRDQSKAHGSHGAHEKVALDEEHGQTLDVDETENDYLTYSEDDISQRDMFEINEPSDHNSWPSNTEIHHEGENSINSDNETQLDFPEQPTEQNLPLPVTRVLRSRASIKPA